MKRKSILSPSHPSTSIQADEDIGEGSRLSNEEYEQEQEQEHEQVKKKISKTSKTSSVSSRPRGLQSNGDYVFPKTLSKDNLIFKKIYQLMGLGFPSLKSNFNSQFITIPILKKYLGKYLKNIPSKEKFTAIFSYKILYIRMLTNLWTFLIVHQEDKYKKLIFNYLINEIGKLRKTLNDNLYMIIFIEKTPTYEKQLFTNFLDTIKNSDISKYDIKVINSEEAVDLHYEILTRFHSQFTNKNMSVKLQKYILYSPYKFAQNSYELKDIIKNMDDRKILYNFQNVTINSETCEIKKIDGGDNSDNSSPSFTFKCKKIRS